MGSEKGTILAVCPREADPKSAFHNAAVLSGIRLTSQGFSGGQDAIRFHCVAPAFPSGQKDAIIRVGKIKTFTTNINDGLGGATYLDRHPVMCPYNHFLTSLEAFGIPKKIGTRVVAHYWFTDRDPYYDGDARGKCDNRKSCAKQNPGECNCDPSFDRYNRKSQSEKYTLAGTGEFLLYT